MSKHKLKYQNIKKCINKLVIYNLALVINLFVYSFIFLPNALGSEPSSTNFKIESYSFGGGGMSGGSSTNFKLNGVLGEVESGQISSTNFKSGNGLSFLQTVNVPPAPTFTNPSNYYNKLSITLNNGGNPTDTKFAIAISPDAFVSTTKYVQSDDTIGSSAVWQTNTVWGSSGFTIIGLTPGTTYTVKVSAMQGNFTQSAYGPTASAATINPTLSFSLSTNSLNIGTLTPGTVVSSSTVTTTISTNGTGGAGIYAYDNNSGLLSNSTGSTITSSTSNLGSVTSGYGLQGTSVTQSSGGPMEIDSPFNVSSNNVGILNTTKQLVFDSTNAPVTSGQGVFVLKAEASSTTKEATDYADTLTIIAAATF